MLTQEFARTIIPLRVTKNTPLVYPEPVEMSPAGVRGPCRIVQDHLTILRGTVRLVLDDTDVTLRPWPR